jgi:hypothetical protein
VRLCALTSIGHGGRTPDPGETLCIFHQSLAHTLPGLPGPGLRGCGYKIHSIEPVLLCASDHDSLKYLQLNLDIRSHSIELRRRTRTTTRMRGGRARACTRTGKSVALGNILRMMKENNALDILVIISPTLHSWGTAERIYDSIARQVDAFTWDNPEFVAIFPVGNTGQQNGAGATVRNLPTPPPSPSTSANGATCGGHQMHHTVSDTDS